MHNKLILVISAAALFVGCRDSQRAVRLEPAPTAEPEVILRSYEVPTGQGEQLRSILGGVFQGLKETVAARATLSPDGQLVVVAPAGIHTGVAELVAKMAKRPPPEAPPSIELQYWLVAGRQIKESKENGFGDHVNGFGNLNNLTPALQTIEQSRPNPMEFSLLESLRLRTIADARGMVAGRFARLDQVASLSGNKVIADINCGTGKTRFETRVAIVPGDWLVLGEVGFEPLPEMWKKPGPPSTLFLIVQAEVRTDNR